MARAQTHRWGDQRRIRARAPWPTPGRRIPVQATLGTHWSRYLRRGD